jgi:AcrR family transcriptional regulator
MSGAGARDPSLGLRERKKRQTRQALLDAAERLFETHGYDHVTVAQIADAASISVKTLFTYFASKEDLAFGDEARLRDALVTAVAGRPPGQSPVAAAAGELRRMIGAPDAGGAASSGGAASGVEGYHRAIGDSAALRSRLRRMWAEYEDAVAEAIMESSQRLPAADARLQAMQVIVLVRSLTTEEVRGLVAAAADPHRALMAWISRAEAELGGHRAGTVEVSEY